MHVLLCCCWGDFRWNFPFTLPLKRVFLTVETSYGPLDALDKTWKRDNISRVIAEASGGGSSASGNGVVGGNKMSKSPMHLSSQQLQLQLQLQQTWSDLSQTFIVSSAIIICANYSKSRSNYDSWNLATTGWNASSSLHTNTTKLSHSLHESTSSEYGWSIFV